MKIKAIRNRVIVKKDEVEKTFSGTSILLPEFVQQVPLTGTVVEVGPGFTTTAGAFVPITVKKGDRIVFARSTGTSLEEIEKGLISLNEKDILAVFRKPRKTTANKMLKKLGWEKLPGDFINPQIAED